MSDVGQSGERGILVKKKDVQCYSRKLTNDSYSLEENMSTPEGGKKGAKREQGKAKGGYIIFSPTKVTSAINITQQHHYSTLLKMCGNYMAKNSETNMTFQVKWIQPQLITYM